jgi:hypothetical protein
MPRHRQGLQDVRIAARELHGVDRAGQCRVDLVGHARGKPPQRGHLLGNEELLVAELQRTMRLLQLTPARAEAGPRQLVHAAVRVEAR